MCNIYKIERLKSYNKNINNMKTIKLPDAEAKFLIDHLSLEKKNLEFEQRYNKGRPPVVNEQLTLINNILAHLKLAK